MSSRVLTELENIDDEAENKDIVMVKVDIDLDDKHILEKLGIPNNLPKLALFEEDQPAQLFEGMNLLSDTLRNPKYLLWNSLLWSFQGRYTKLERFLAKN